MSSGFPSRSSPPGIPIVGLVGGVGAGKSSLVREIGSLRLCVIDADRIGHEQLLVDSIREKIVDEFGNEIINANGEIDRRRLAEMVFGSSEFHQLKRQRLNEIVHPAIQEEIRRQIQGASEDVDAIVIDAALLLEAGWANECDALIFIETPKPMRQARVAQTRGWSADEHERREASQWSSEQKQKSCQYTVDNSGTPEAAALQLENYLKEIIQQHHQ